MPHLMANAGKEPCCALWAAFKEIQNTALCSFLSGGDPCAAAFDTTFVGLTGLSVLCPSIEGVGAPRFVGKNLRTANQLPRAKHDPPSLPFTLSRNWCYRATNYCNVCL